MTPIFHSWQDFLHMGGYGYYVWFAYAMMGLVLGANFFFSRRRFKRLLKFLRSQY